MSYLSYFPEWLAQAMDALRTGDIDGWMKIYAPDAIHEFPLAAQGAIRSLSGRDEIAGYMGQLPEHVRFGTISDIRVREAGNELIIEAIGHHYRLPANIPLNLRYIWFITMNEGLVSHFRDYMVSLESGPAQ